MSKDLHFILRERDLEIESRSREPDYHLHLLQMRDFNLFNKQNPKK